MHLKGINNCVYKEIGLSTSNTTAKKLLQYNYYSLPLILLYSNKIITSKRRGIYYLMRFYQ